LNENALMSGGKYATFKSFEKQVLPELLQRGIAPIGMKSLSGTADAIKKGILTPQEALAYVMSLPATVCNGNLRKDVPVERLYKNLLLSRGIELHIGAQRGVKGG
jgi:hypothetical protein